MLLHINYTSGKNVKVVPWLWPAGNLFLFGSAPRQHPPHPLHSCCTFSHSNTKRRWVFCFLSRARADPGLWVGLTVVVGGSRQLLSSALPGGKRESRFIWSFDSERKEFARMKSCVWSTWHWARNLVLLISCFLLLLFEVFAHLSPLFGPRANMPLQRGRPGCCINMAPTPYSLSSCSIWIISRDLEWSPGICWFVLDSILIVNSKRAKTMSALCAAITAGLVQCPAQSKSSTDIYGISE